MKLSKIEHVVVDEANQRTYVVRANQPLTDGEIYRWIRLGIRRQGGQAVPQGETLTIDTAEMINLERINRRSKRVR
jgi:hypothetical protein